MEESMEAGMRNFMRAGYKGVTETWNVLQHEVGSPSWGRKFHINALCVVCSFCLQND